MQTNAVSNAASTPSPANMTEVNSALPVDFFSDLLERQLSGANVSAGGIQGGEVASTEDASDETAAEEDMLLSEATDITMLPQESLLGQSFLGQSLPAAMLVLLSQKNSLNDSRNLAEIVGVTQKLERVIDGKNLDISTALQAFGDRESQANLFGQQQQLAREDETSQGDAAAEQLLSAGQNPSENFSVENNNVNSLGDQGAPSPHLFDQNLSDISQPASAGLPHTASTSATFNTHLPHLPPPAQVTLNTPFAHSAWGNEFNKKITWLATQREQSAELHLNPPQLGALEVAIKINGDQAAAVFTSPHAAVREAIENSLPKLRELLADNGITLGNVTVGDQSAREQFNREHASSPAPVARGWENNISPVLHAVNSLRQRGMVDVFA